MVRKIEKIETAVETKFQEYFVNAMAIPHKTDAFPNLSKVVKLSPKNASTPDHARVKGERRRKRK